MKKLSIFVSPFVSVGEEITVDISAVGVSSATIELSYPDNIRLSGEDELDIPLGHDSQRMAWTVLSLSEGTSGMVRVLVTSGALVQAGVVKITPDNA